MSNINIIKEKCIGCKICVSACPYNAIEIVYKKAVINENCTLCSACEKSCKFGALIFEKDETKKIDTSGYSGVWVLAEQRYKKLKTVSLELIGKSKELSSKLNVEVTAVVIGDDIQALSKELIAYGADKVMVVDSKEMKDFNEQLYGDILIDLIKEHKPEIFLVGATSNGRSIAPYISAKLKTGLTADCTCLDIDQYDRALLQTRPAFGGNLMATIICPNNRPQMATVRPKVFKPINPDYSRKGKIISISAPKNIEAFVKLINYYDNNENLNLTDADIIVSVGRGIGNSKNIYLAEELAKALGAALGASRPVVDLGWMPYSQQVGQTGKTVAPKIYIACGISGAVQHLAGLAEIDTVVAINIDSEAPIFKIANYGIVGDVKEILPLLTEEIKKTKNI